MLSHNILPTLENFAFFFFSFLLSYNLPGICFYVTREEGALSSPFFPTWTPTHTMPCMELFPRWCVTPVQSEVKLPRCVGLCRGFLFCSIGLFVPLPLSLFK